MDYNAILEKAAAYTQKFVDAAIPVAKQAYEIGLMTLQIDAAGDFVIAIVLCIISYTLFRLLFAHKARCQAAADLANEKRGYVYRSWDDFSGFDNFGLGLCVMLSLIPAVVSLIVWLNIWLYVKLFKPELWLAKQAIDAVINAVK